MHEIHCRRHIILCEHCQEPIPRSEQEQHYNEFHAKVPCEQCHTSIAKDALEVHMDKECHKRPVKCEFCELPMPKSEHNTHIGYCGSRTEQCPTCQQYIMLKDMTRHEESMCTFPEPKPVPVSTNNSDPFRMNEFQYMLDQELGAVVDNFPDFTFNLRQDLERTRNPLPTREPSTRSEKPSNNDNRKVANVVKKKPNINIEKNRNIAPRTSDAEEWRANSPPTTIPPDMDYDTMLALQMAHEDWWQDQQDPTPPTEDTFENRDNSFNIEELMNHVRQNSNSTTAEHKNLNRQPINLAANEYSEEDMCIPCEFCNMDIPLSTYLEHVESCPVNEDVRDNRYNIPVEAEPVSRASIPVINNLRTNDSLVSSVNDTPLSREDINEQFILPCEFCEELFPADVIFQHQNVCQANGMATPRSATPSVNNFDPPHTSTTVKSKTNKKSILNPSLIDFVDDNNLDRATSRSSHTHDKSFNFHKKPSDSPTDKYHPGLNRFDDAVARPPRRPSRQNEFSSNIQTPSNEASAQRPSKSAQRARARLHQLLQEESAVGAVSERRKTSKTDLTEKKSGSKRDQRTQVNSRTVMSQLDRPGQRKETNRAPVSRSRQRADHVFSPDIRLKPPPNPKK